MLTVGVIGYGYWGPKLVRNFDTSSKTRVGMIADQQPERLQAAAADFPHVRLTSKCYELITDPEVDAVAVATPSSTHYGIAKEAIRNGKHVLLEKPIATSSDEAEELIELAERHKVVLFVDHTFVYTPAVRKIKQLLDSGEIGRPYYYDSMRISLGLFQKDVNVLWDLAVHDLGIIDHLFGVQPRAVSATGGAHLPGRPENVAYLTCYYDDDFLAHVNVNWLAPAKVRLVVVGGDKRMVVYDDNEADQKIKVFDKGVEPATRDEAYKSMLSYRVGDMWAPNLERTEALKTEVLHFTDCVENGTRPTTDGAAGLRVLKILEAASQSLAQRGVPVEL